MAGPQIEALIRQLSKLPGLGPRSARRIALALIKRRESLLDPLVQTLAAASEAVKVCTGGTSFFELANVELIHSNGRAIIVSQVYCLPENTPLIGCVYADPDHDAAVAQSVLDAINRKLEIYTADM